MAIQTEVRQGLQNAFLIYILGGMNGNIPKCYILTDNIKTQKRATIMN